MDVSIVVPTRNRSALLSRTLRSALSQERVDFEVIVVDEASNDETPALLAGLDDHRVRVLRHDIPRGLSAARYGAASPADPAPTATQSTPADFRSSQTTRAAASS